MQTDRATEGMRMGVEGNRCNDMVGPVHSERNFFPLRPYVMYRKRKKVGLFTSALLRAHSTISVGQVTSAEWHNPQQQSTKKISDVSDFGWSQKKYEKVSSRVLGIALLNQVT